MENDILDLLASEAMADIRAAQLRADALSCISRLRSDLEHAGFHAAIDLDDDGKLTLSIDLDQITECSLPAPVATEIPGSIQRAPDVIEAQDEPAPAEPEPAPEAAKPEQPAPPKLKLKAPKPAPLKSGPLVDGEAETIIEMTLAGQTPREIAAHLGRALKWVNNWKYRNRDRIEAARAAPEPETPAAAPAAPTPQPSPAPKTPPAGGEMTIRQRDIRAHLDALGHINGWTPKRDLMLASALARGDGASAAAQSLGIDKAAAISRWQALNRDPSNINHQADLLKVLRHQTETAT